MVPKHRKIMKNISFSESNENEIIAAERQHLDTEKRTLVNRHRNVGNQNLFSIFNLTRNSVFE